jgi:hypothetical protein
LQIVIFLPLNHTPTINTIKNKEPTNVTQAKHQTVWGKADKVRLAALIDGRPALLTPRTSPSKSSRWCILSISATATKVFFAKITRTSTPYLTSRTNIVVHNAVKLRCFACIFYQLLHLRAFSNALLPPPSFLIVNRTRIHCQQRGRHGGQCQGANNDAMNEDVNDTDNNNATLPSKAQGAGAMRRTDPAGTRRVFPRCGAPCRVVVGARAGP